MSETIGTTSKRRARGASFLVWLALGHTAVHWYQQMWPVIIPSVKASLGLTDIQIGVLSSVRQFTSGPLGLPSGILADFFRKRTAVIFAVAFVFFGLSYFLVALAASFVWIVPAVALLGVGTALWHPAAVGSLSIRFPQRRGSALAIHGIGASLGDTTAPIAIGALLLGLTWQRLLELHMIPALIIALLLWRALGAHYKEMEGSRPSLNTYLKEAKGLVLHRVVLAIIGVNVLTGMARFSIVTFLPVYIQDDLEYSALGLGFFWGLLHAMGAVSQPIMGYLSDRFGRKVVLVPSLVVFGLLYLALSVADSGVQLILVIGALGLFFYALASVTQATVLDVAGANVQSSTMGITGMFSQFLSLPGPIIAGIFATQFGTESVFLFSGAVTLLAALLLAAIHVPRSSRPTPRILG